MQGNEVILSVAGSGRLLKVFYQNFCASLSAEPEDKAWYQGQVHWLCQMLCDPDPCCSLFTSPLSQSRDDTKHQEMPAQVESPGRGGWLLAEAIPPVLAVLQYRNLGHVKMCICGTGRRGCLTTELVKSSTTSQQDETQRDWSWFHSLERSWSHGREGQRSWCFKNISDPRAKKEKTTIKRKLIEVHQQFLP